MDYNLLNKIFNKGFTRGEIERLGNAIIFITSKLGPQPKTKVLKLLYFFEEKSVADSGMPFFGLKWKVWKLGPVDQTIFIELSGDTDILKEYISVKQLEDGTTSISGTKPFDDGEFSDYDISLMEKVVESLGGYNASKLSMLTHKKGGLWDSIVTEYGLQEKFDRSLQTVSDYEIDFSNLVEGDEFKLQMYSSYFDLKSADRKYS